MTIDHHAPPPPAGPVPWDKDFALQLLADMLRIRRMEEKSAELYGAGKIRGFLHLYIGEEAVAVGALHALRPADNVVATYREHGHALVRGLSMEAIMAEMFGKQRRLRARPRRLDAPVRRGDAALRWQRHRRRRAAARDGARAGGEAAERGSRHRLLLRRRRGGRGRLPRSR